MTLTDHDLSRLRRTISAGVVWGLLQFFVVLACIAAILVLVPVFAGSLRNAWVLP